MKLQAACADMLQRFGHQIVARLWHRCVSPSGSSLLLCLLGVLITCKVHAQEPAPPDRIDDPAADRAAGDAAADRCLPDGRGFLRARLSGTLRADLDWGNDGTACTGAVRPADGGIRMRFSRGNADSGERIVVVFGIAALREGRSAQGLPVNVTVIREGTGEFYSTQGDDKCMLDTVTQEPIVGIPHRTRSYRIVARGFCTEPARAVRGTGAVMLSRFDYAGRVDFESEDTTDDDPLVAGRSE